MSAPAGNMAASAAAGADISCGKRVEQGEDEEMGNGSETGTFTLLLFAAAATYTGTDTLLLPIISESTAGSGPAVPGMSIPQLFALLEARFPGIRTKVLNSCAVTVNLEYVDLDLDADGHGEGQDGHGHEIEVRIMAGDEVGIIPPVSSG